MWHTCFVSSHCFRILCLIWRCWLMNSSFIMSYCVCFGKTEFSKLSEMIHFCNPIAHLHVCMHRWFFQVLEKGISRPFFSNQSEKKLKNCSLSPRSWTVVISSIISRNDLLSKWKSEMRCLDSVEICGCGIFSYGVVMVVSIWVLLPVGGDGYESFLQV